MEVASQLDMEVRSPERDSLHWYRVHRVLAMVDLFPLDSCAWRDQQEQIGHAWKIPL